MISFGHSSTLKVCIKLPLQVVRSAISLYPDWQLHLKLPEVASQNALIDIYKERKKKNKTKKNHILILCHGMIRINNI